MSRAPASSRSASRRSRRRRCTTRSPQLEGSRAERAARTRASSYDDGRASTARRAGSCCYVAGLAERQDDRIERAKGPAVEGRLRRRGQPDEGRRGLRARQGRRRRATSCASEESGGEYVFAVVERLGAPAPSVLPELLAALAAGLDWPKSSDGGAATRASSAPCAGCSRCSAATSCRCEFAGLTAGRVTRGHRFLAPEPIEVPARRRVPRGAERGHVRARPGGARAAHPRGHRRPRPQARGARAVVPEKTFAEVVNLVEWPTVAVGQLRRGVPRGAARGARDRDGVATSATSRSRAPTARCCTRFVVVHNGDPARTDAIVAGHERVIRARLADAAFFYREDLQVADGGAASRGSTTIVFQEKLGTLADKVERIEALAGALADAAGARAGRRPPYAERAAHLRQGRPREPRRRRVPDAAGRHGPLLRARRRRGRARSPTRSSSTTGRASPATRCPRRRRACSSRSPTSSTRSCGIFAIGQAPTGSADPYALRRGAIGMLGDDRSTAACALHARPTRSPRRSTATAARCRTSTASDVGAQVRDFVARPARRACCGTAGTRTTPSPRCSPWPATIPADAARALRGAHAVPRDEPRDRRPLRRVHAGARTSREPDARAPTPTRRSWAPRSARSPTRSTRAEARGRDALGATATTPSALGGARRRCAARSTRSSTTVLVMDPDEALRDNRLAAAQPLRRRCSSASPTSASSRGSARCRDRSAPPSTSSPTRSARRPTQVAKAALVAVRAGRVPHRAPAQDHARAGSSRASCTRHCGARLRLLLHARGPAAARARWQRVAEATGVDGVDILGPAVERARAGRPASSPRGEAGADPQDRPGLLRPHRGAGVRRQARRRPQRRGARRGRDRAHRRVALEQDAARRCTSRSRATRGERPARAGRRAAAASCSSSIRGASSAWSPSADVLVEIRGQRMRELGGYAPAYADREAVERELEEARARHAADRLPRGAHGQPRRRGDRAGDPPARRGVAFATSRLSAASATVAYCAAGVCRYAYRYGTIAGHAGSRRRGQLSDVKRVYAFGGGRPRATRT